MRIQMRPDFEDLYPAIAAVSDVDIALRVRRDRVRGIELAGPGAPGSHGGDESSVLVILHNPRIAIAIGDEDIAGCIPGHIGRPIEAVRSGC